VNRAQHFTKAMHFLLSRVNINNPRHQINQYSVHEVLEMLGDLITQEP